MTNEDERMSDTEFLDEIDNARKRIARTCRQRGRKLENDLFAKIKVKMVMRVYGVSHSRALEIISEREVEKEVPKMTGSAIGKNGRTDETFMTAEEFFA